MKKITMVGAVAVLISVSAFAQDASQLKEMSLNMCNTQAEQLPEEQRSQVSEVCKCTVENTDYDKVLKLSQAGDVAQVQKDAMAVAEKCSAG